VERPAISPVKPRFQGRECILAFRALEEHLGERFVGAVATELGGGNTAAAMVVAAEAGLPIVDADAAGRSVPDLQHSTYYLKGIPIAPMGVATKYGDVMVLQEVADDFHAEAIVRAAAVASGGSVGVVDHPGPVGRLSRALVKGSLGHARRLGAALREARAKDRAAPAALLTAGDGFLLFTGTVEGRTHEERGGFTYGEVHLRGGGLFGGRRYRVRYKNEHIISWLDGEVDVTAPDLITLVRASDGAPILNPHAPEGEEVWALGFRAPRPWRSERGLAILGPTYFGFDVPFQPIEDRHAPWRG
jgi:hypothetical protein